jgi:lysophospholipase L1-like esterase
MKQGLREIVRLSLPALVMLAPWFAPAQSPTADNEHWVATWATGQDLAQTVQEKPVFPPNVKMPDFSKMERPSPPLAVAENQTVRMIVHTSIGGRQIRLELSNAFGKGTVSIGKVHVAIRRSESAIEPGSDHEVKFSGNSTLEIRPGSIIVSDPVDLQVKPMSDLAVSLYVSKSDGAPTAHTVGLHRSYIAPGDSVADASMADSKPTTSYFWLRGVDVLTSADNFAIACLGDSITDGFATTIDANKAWPTQLADRLNEAPNGPRISVLNEGVSGNQVLRDGAGVSALARFDRDVLSLPGVRWMVLLEGINDINLHGQVSDPGALVPDDLIRGYRQLIARAHMYGIKVVGATLTPEEGVWLSGPVGEATRQTLNEWIRTSKEFDAVVDFDSAVRDNSHAARLLPAFNPGDNIHPNDGGNRAMADTFNLEIFAH